MSTHNICFYGEITIITPKLSSNTLLICSTEWQTCSPWSDCSWRVQVYTVCPDPVCPKAKDHYGISFVNKTCSTFQVVDANKDKTSMLQTFQELKSKILFGYDTRISWYSDLWKGFCRLWDLTVTQYSLVLRGETCTNWYRLVKTFPDLEGQG